MFKKVELKKRQLEANTPLPKYTARSLRECNRR